MKIGVDSSILVAGIHANHPLHAVAASWLISNIPLHELIVTHHFSEFSSQLSIIDPSKLS